MSDMDMHWDVPELLIEVSQAFGDLRKRVGITAREEGDVLIITARSESGRESHIRLSPEMRADATGAARRWAEMCRLQLQEVPGE